MTTVDRTLLPTSRDRTLPTSRARPPRVEQILHIADKPKVALKLAKALFPKMSDSDLKNKRTNRGRTAYKIDKHCFTSVNGSITKFDVPDFRDWNDPLDIIGCELKGGCKLDELCTNKLLEQHIQAEAQISDRVMIWTDCDDEGEFIAHRLSRICLTAGLLDDRDVTIKRVRFDSLDSEEIIKAERRARDEKGDGINMKVVAAVEFQKKLDTIACALIEGYQGQGVTWLTDIRENIKEDMEVIKNGGDGKKLLRKHLEMWKTKLSRIPGWQQMRMKKRRKRKLLEEDI